MLNLYLFSLLGCNSDDGLKIYNAEPLVSIQSHADGALIQEGAVTTFFALASDANHQPEELLIAWFAYGVNGVELTNCDWMPPDAAGVSSCDLMSTPMPFDLWSTPKILPMRRGR